MPPKEKLLNTKGASTWLGCTENWIHKLVFNGRLKAYVYDDQGTLIEHQQGTRRQGQGLYFYEKDLKTFKEKGKRSRGRPIGSKNKQPQAA